MSKGRNFLTIGLFLVCGSAYADSVKVTPIQKNDRSIFIQSASIYQANQRDAVSVTGLVRDKNAHLIYNSKLVPLEEMQYGNKFTVNFYSNKTNKQNLYLTVVNAKGEVQNKAFVVERVQEEKPTPKKKVSGDFGLGMSSLNYTESQLAYNSSAVSAFGSIRFLLTDNWAVKGSLKLFLITLSSSDPDYDMKFFNGDLLLGYIVPLNDWEFSFYGGGFLENTVVTNNAFGVNNITGPEISFEAKKYFKNHHSLSAYVKAGEINAGSLSLSDNQVTVGGGYAFPGLFNKETGLFIDYSKTSVPALETNLSILSFGVKLSF